MRSIPALCVALLLLAGPAPAQQSASYKLKAPVLNAGGNPGTAGQSPSSASYRLLTDSVGDGAVAASLASASYRMGGGFTMSFPRPGEVTNLSFSDAVTLAWDTLPLAAHYHLYRTPPTGSAVGVTPSADCRPPDVAGTTTTDTDVPPPGTAFFYLVTAANCIGLEGPDGTIGTRCQ